MNESSAAPGRYIFFYTPHLPYLIIAINKNWDNKLGHLILILPVHFQTLKAWTTELNMLLEKFPTLDHVSLYQLTLERGTALWKDVAAGNLTMPVEDCVVDMYEAAVEILSRAGIHRYEISNFARTKEKVMNRNKLEKIVIT